MNVFCVVLTVYLIVYLILILSIKSVHSHFGVHLMCLYLLFYDLDRTIVFNSIRSVDLQSIQFLNVRRARARAMHSPEQIN